LGVRGMGQRGTPVSPAASISGLMAHDSGLGDRGFGFKVSGFRFIELRRARVQGLGVWGWGFGLRV